MVAAGTGDYSYVRDLFHFTIHGKVWDSAVPLAVRREKDVNKA